MGTGGAGVFIIIMFVIAPLVIGPFEKLNKAMSESTKKTLTWIWIALIAIIIAVKAL